MDKEVREELAQVLAGRGSTVVNNHRKMATIILNAGYCKLLKDKPPLLSDEFLQSIKTKVFNPFKYYEDDEHLRDYSQLDALREVAQTQREADIKFYTEELIDS